MLVLASASPRRQELLRNAGIAFTVQPADVDETPLAGEMPRPCAQRLAREKALAVWSKRPEKLVLGADTIVVVEGAILGKPANADDAARMLRLLAGRVHRVITGVCLVKGLASGDLGDAAQSASPVQLAGNSYEIQRTENREVKTTSETTLVTMNGLCDEQIREYVATG